MLSRRLLLQSSLACGAAAATQKLAMSAAEATPVPDAAYFYPHHEGGVFAPRPSQIVAQWPARAFAENLVVDATGAVFVSLYSHNRVYRYDPATGETSEFAKLAAPPMGIAVDGNGPLWVTSGTLFKSPGYVWKIASGGLPQLWCHLPDAPFTNGCALHPNRRVLLVCESLTGRILAVDLNRPDRWSVWLKDDRLKPVLPKYPGANGIKIRNGWAWISVSGRGLLVRVRIRADGSAGEIEKAGTSLSADDFAFGASSAAYIATHPENTVVRLDPSGARTTIAGPEQGVVGSTACAFGRAPGDTKALYVTTDGGLIFPYKGRIQDAILVRIDVGEPGWPETTSART
jgi:sugar lactone lactonase YvrE